MKLLIMGTWNLKVSSLDATTEVLTGPIDLKWPYTRYG
jgi:hypothetical protein